MLRSDHDAVHVFPPHLLAGRGDRIRSSAILFIPPSPARYRIGRDDVWSTCVSCFSALSVGEVSHASVPPSFCKIGSLLFWAFFWRDSLYPDTALTPRVSSVVPPRASLHPPPVNFYFIYIYVCFLILEAPRAFAMGRVFWFSSYFAFRYFQLSHGTLVA